MAKRLPALAGYNQTSSGLYVPSSVIADLATMSPEDLSKAARDPEFQKKMGQLFNIYAQVWNNLTQYGAAEKPRTTPTHKFLREAARQSLVDRLLINARCHQIRHVAHRVVVEGKQKGFNVVHKKHSDPNFKVTDDIVRRCNEVEEIVLHPNPEVHPTGIRDFLIKAVRGELVIDRKAMVIIRDSKGRPRNFHLLPPDDIKPRYEVLLSFMKELGLQTQDAAMSAIFEKFGVDVTSAAYIQEIDGQVHGAWSADEMSVDITNPSDELNRYGYGESALELSLEATTLLLLGLQYNKANFTSNYPEAFLVFEGDVDQQGLEALKRQIYAEVGSQGNQRLPIFSTGGAEIGKAQLLKLRESLKDMQFLQLLRFAIALKCSAYRAHPSLINFSGDMGKERAVVSNDDQETQIALSQEEGFHSILDNVASWLTRMIVEPWYDDLEMIWSVAEAPSEPERIDINTKKASTYMTVDEIRASEGLPPLEESTEGQATGVVILNSVWQQAQAMRQQAQQANEMAKFGVAPGMEGAMGPADHADEGKPGQPGQPQGQPGEDDGFSGMEQPGGVDDEIGLDDLPDEMKSPATKRKTGSAKGGQRLGKSLTIFVDEEGNETEVEE